MNIGFRNTSREEIQEGLPTVFPRIWRYALMLSGSRDKANDLAQSVCLRAIEKSGQFQAGTELDRWLFRITHNLWVSELRRSSAQTSGSIGTIDPGDVIDPTQDPDTKLQHKELIESVLKLPEAQRQVVVLVYAEGYSYREAAEILDIPIGTVMSRLASARTTMKQKHHTQKETWDAR
jgi:RNA polymerase sigma-70 factor (ECF subfamily)